MSIDSYNPDQAATLIGISPSSTRNWCKWYARHLSPAANPGPGNERRLSQQDVATLQQVKVWRDAGHSTDEVATLLQAAASANEQARYTIDVTPTPQPPQDDTQPHSGDFLAPAVLHALQSQQDAMQAQINSLRQDYTELQRQQRKAADLLVTGMIVGGMIVLLFTGVLLRQLGVGG